MEETKVCSKCGEIYALSFFTIKNGKYTNLCRKCKRERDRKFYSNNKSIINVKQKDYYKKNAISIKNRVKDYYWENREDILLDNRSNVERKNRRNENFRNRYKTEPNLVIKNRIRVRMWELLRNNKSNNTISILGCSVDECRKYLESNFLPGMTWENYGEWEIDHIIPCASFDLTKPEEQLKCFHYTNLQPLWEFDNRSKRDKIIVLTSEGIFLV